MADSNPSEMPGRPAGIFITTPDGAQRERDVRRLLDHLDALGLADDVTQRPVPVGQCAATSIALTPDAFERLAPAYDTLELHARLGTGRAAVGSALARETMLALLASPIPYPYPSADEAIAAARIRANTALAGRETALAFTTEAAERPWDLWQYDESTGFTLKPGAALIPALQAATQPARTGQLYSFSCYRASEYVMLLGIAQEIEHRNPPLFARLTERWRSKAIQSGQFHDVFLREYGSQAEPFAFGHYVPGDRVWFRNPDANSANVEGYEGSWVVYLGGGLFTNFWKRDAPFTFDAKCLELYHWRHAVVAGANGKPAIDETIVEARVAATLEDPDAVARIMTLMKRYRDPTGTWGDGGCIDSTRESARWVCPGTADLAIPPA